ncbi:restriction endonuclease subunit S [Cryobacterium psychrophilum]|uniref:Restriction endonuclease subunit S n=1 Tax=Cryobacterium psychrophilum TaxID=41988 RepID=A0A4Y8KMQ8_9MICO|nr:restriction endonuclease subunit S [Cryobacterium psychrophilum]TDW30358.1 type I restriction enzyme S subunit [Cryobacterium psychrophilum]TFD79053.1 restriction endonuclease subunit S [Cryobacterium psychrophilum]
MSVEVASPWRSIPLGRVCSLNDDVLSESTDANLEIDYIEISDVDLAEGVKNSTTLRFGDAPSRARRIIRTGDVLVSTVRTYLRAIGAVTAQHSGAVASTGFAVLRPRKIRPNYLAYVVHSEAFVGEVISRSVGVSYPAINAVDMLKIHVDVPSESEQRQIAEYLDRETGQIDALITKQEKLVETLIERRQAAVTHAVTRGLDPNVELRDSGIDLLERIPKHWRVAQLKRHLFKIEQGVSPEASAELADGNSWGVLKAGCVNRGIFSDVEHKKLPDDFAFKPALAVHVGDLLVNRASGSPSLVGSAAIVRDLRYKVILSDKIFRLLVRPATSSAFLELVFQSALYRTQVLQSISGAEGLANNLPSSALKRFWIPTPPLAEQNEIVAHLDVETKRIDVLVNKSRQVVHVLKERRQALISAAVTGKIDVRGL